MWERKRKEGLSDAPEEVLPLGFCDGVLVEELENGGSHERPFVLKLQIALLFEVVVSNACRKYNTKYYK